MDCKQFEEQWVLRLCDELSPAEREPLEAHRAACAHCARIAAELEQLRAACAERPRREPTPELLARCRLDLEEALDRESTSWRALLRSGFGLWPMGSTLRLTAAFAVLLIGFSLGWTLRQQNSVPTPTTAGNQSWLGADLTNTRISGISRVSPDPQTGDVRITLDAERRFTLEGSLDDPRIQQVLLYAVKSYDNPGIRYDTLEILRRRSSNPAVRNALLYALRNDPNDGVRLQALQALEELPWNAEMRKAVLYSLENDKNPGVRVAAINLLARHADEEVMPKFEELAVRDPNPYVRLKCANAVREKAGKEF